MGLHPSPNRKAMRPCMSILSNSNGKEFQLGKPLLKNIKFWLGFVLSAFFLWLSLKGANWTEVRQAFSTIDYIYLIPFAILTILSNYAKSIRWRYLLMEIKNIPLYQMFCIIMISNLILNILPARIGDVARAYLVAKKYNISKTAVFSSIVVERIFDGCFTMIVFAMTLWIYSGNIDISIPGIPEFSLRKAMFLFSSVFLAALFFVLWLKLFPVVSKRTIRGLLHLFPETVKERAAQLLGSFITGLNVFHNGKYLMFSLFATALEWVLITYSYYVCLKAFSINEPFYLSFILMGFIVIAVMIPGAPGYIGIFHFAIQIALQKFFHVESSIALSYAWVVWLSAMLVNVIPGIYYFNKYNLSMNKLRKEETN